MLKADKASISVSLKYTDFIDVFPQNLATKLLQHTKINDYVINLIKGYQPPYNFIYSLGPVELKTLKIYIETNLAKKFIWPSKFLASAPIFFVKKSDRSFQLYVYY